MVPPAARPIWRRRSTSQAPAAPTAARSGSRRRSASAFATRSATRSRPIWPAVAGSTLEETPSVATTVTVGMDAPLGSDSAAGNRARVGDHEEEEDEDLGRGHEEPPERPAGDRPEVPAGRHRVPARREHGDPGSEREPEADRDRQQ